GRIYFAGDTGYGAHFGEISARLGAPDLALLPIGAYEPRWFMAAQHINPREAVEIMLDCGAAQAFGHHWGTFRLTDEPIEAPAEELALALAEKGIPPERFQPLRPGQSAELNWT
ncbi:MAG TPA: MBL fold metallo-hydrolase, partial [Propylenella sp.]|nr:MBL fold metallo-hydrolase [Propylenella sp.]